MEVQIKYLTDGKIPGHETAGPSVLVVAKIPHSPKNPYGRIGKYHIQCYKCGFICHLSHLIHTVEITNGKVTITPSILCPIEKCKEHYFIKDGEVC